MAGDPKLLEYCQTERQREILEALINSRTNQEAADKLGITVRNVLCALARVKKHAALNGYAPGHFETGSAPGFNLKKVTIHRKHIDGESEIKNTWERQIPAIEDLKSYLEEFIGGFTAKKVKVPKYKFTKSKVDKDVIPWFQIGDAHIGMLAHEMEVGHNFDLRIAEKELKAALGQMIDEAPLCERCVIQDMGDATHYENMSATTEASGHSLDFDTRFPKMIYTYGRVMRYIVEKALERFKFVDVIINQGNHSRTNDFWMAFFLRNIYEDNSRLTILNNESVFIPYRMGNVFVLSHHGDKCKPEKMVDVMHVDFRQDAGEAKYKYLDGGHIHTKKQSYEVGGCVYESFNQLAPSDKYAHDHGWRSRSCLTTLLRSKTYGEQGRKILTAEEVRDRIHKLPKGTTPKERRKVHTVF